MACAVGAVLLLVGLVRPPTAPTTPVLVAARDLEAGAVLTGTDLRTAQLPGGADGLGVAGTVRDPNDLVGRRLTSPAQGGEVITTGRVVPRSAAEGLPPDTFAAHVLHADRAALDLISPGQRVTVFADTGGDPLAVDVLVIGVDTTTSPGGTTSWPGSESSLRGVVLALTPQALARVFAVQRPEGGPPKVLTVGTR